jgi:hypothetical protein
VHTIALTRRDHALLRAVAAGRCDLTSPGAELRVDGRWFCDQLRVRVLLDAGLLRAAAAPGRGRAHTTLTGAGRAALAHGGWPMVAPTKG